jgi:endonuclease YncB( thermonuclease family)
MTLLLDIAPYIPPVAPTATGDEIYRRFQEEPDTLTIAVVGTPRSARSGLIERNAFLVRMAAEYGRPCGRAARSRSG